MTLKVKVSWALFSVYMISLQIYYYGILTGVRGASFTLFGLVAIYGYKHKLAIVKPVLWRILFLIDIATFSLKTWIVVPVIIEYRFFWLDYSLWIAGYVLYYWWYGRYAFFSKPIWRGYTVISDDEPIKTAIDETISYTTNNPEDSTTKSK